MKNRQNTRRQLEERNEEIDSLLEKEEVYTNLQELQKYSNEKKEIENQIEKCMKKIFLSLMVMVAVAKAPL